MKLKLHLLSTMLLFSLVCAANAAPDGAPAAIIKPGQKLRLEFQKIAKLEKKTTDGLYPVSAKGLINLPFIGSIKVDGMTAEKAEDAIEQSYKKANIYKTPDVKIKIVE